MFSANRIVGFFHQPYLQNKSMKLPDFLHFYTNSLNLKIDQKFFGWVWSKNGCGQSGQGTLKVAMSQE